MTNRQALITGVTGQDGYYLSKYLRSLGYIVHGFVRRTSTPSETPYVDIIHHGSLECYDSIVRAIDNEEITEIYHLAAQSFVQESFRDPGTTLNVNVLGTQRILEAVKHYNPLAKVYLACSSEQFGNSVMPVGGYHENSMMIPRSPYGVSKLATYHLGRNYRQSFGMFIACGILFNHESPRRGKEFVTRKICDYVKSVHCYPETMSKLMLGNIHACRDWGHAEDYVTAMHLMLQYKVPDDFVIATGEAYSVKDFCDTAFNIRSLRADDYISTNTIEHVRPSEVDYLLGCAHKAKELLGWKPKHTFRTLIEDMLQNNT